MAGRPKEPEVIRYLPPIVTVLREMGGSGIAAEVIDHVIEALAIPEAEQEATLKSGGSRVRNMVQWGRLVLVRGGLLEGASTRGVWALTDKGQTVDLDSFDFLTLLRDVRKQFQAERKERRKSKEEEGPEEDEPLSDDSDYRSELLSLLRSLPASGFERLCQRLLRESGFQQVEVTGWAGDGGIDGIGILQVNAFVSFRVLFQCKRYQGAVNPSQVRDFRGAMQGRADKGIILTTGTFTLDGTKEARRDGVPPIELVDGDALVKLFADLRLGLNPRTTFDVNHRFFDDFRGQRD